MTVYSVSFDHHYRAAYCGVISWTGLKICLLPQQRLITSLHADVQSHLRYAAGQTCQEDVQLGVWGSETPELTEVLQAVPVGAKDHRGGNWHGGDGQGHPLVEAMELKGADREGILREGTRVLEKRMPTSDQVMSRLILLLETSTQIVLWVMLTKSSQVELIPSL